MSICAVRTQAELDAALADNTVRRIEIRSEQGVWLTVSGNRGNSSVEAWGNSSVVAWENSSVEAWGNSSVEAWGNSSVEAWGNSSVEAWENSAVVAWENSSVVARGNSSVEAWENSSVVAWENSSVEARGNSSVVARENSSVEARENSSVEAWENSSVVAWGNSSVEAWENSAVVAWGNSGTHAYDRAQVDASPACAVWLHSADATVSGGVLIDVSKPLTDAAEWCAYHGVTVSKAGVATVYKAVDADYLSGYKQAYRPGSKPVCSDWRDDNGCGNGFHFSPTPREARDYNRDATRFLAVGVKVLDLRPIPGGTPKCKAPRVVRACVEVDIDGKPVAS